MFDVTTTDHLSEDQQNAIGDQLRQFNIENNAAFWAARELQANAARPLYVVARDDQGQFLGGLLAETQFAWLKVSIMAVLPAVRGKGIGSRLLEAAEVEARARGCRYAYVDTIDYQAPGFYQKRGYRIAGKLDDWDSHGHAKFFFVKALDRMAAH